MKKFSMFLIILSLLFVAVSTQADTALPVDTFRMTLPNGWNVVDSGTLARITQIAPDTAQMTGSVVAYSDKGGILCAFARPSQGMTTEFMELFQSEYIGRIEKALDSVEISDITGVQTSCGANNFFCLSFTAVELPISVYYHFSDISVLTIVFVQTTPEDVTQILSAIAQ